MKTGARIGLLTVLAAAAWSVPPAAAERAPRDEPRTFAKDVAPLLQRSCVSCHRPGSIAPMSLIT